MKEETSYYVLKKQAVPEVLLKVLDAKKLIDSGKCKTVNEAAEKIGISRSSFYKYKDDIYEFHDSLQGTTLTLNLQMDDELGLLSDVLKIIAECGANILTIHQAIPYNGVAALSVGIQVLPTTSDITELLEKLEMAAGVHKVQIVGRSAEL
ncbi:MAG: ACT domain-containing protein [Butyrivibrio sp.]|uniref:ACT domain-containing protein n=1 Tax=Butyrivibrio sp. NC2002 TaxID=1410610 RepID=UPI000564540D|nr:ACT domain-containing protein [Butyrivibrio sp. NC2002]MBE5860948.1 ACT domain-containing protein [Butyrivibrio sp.]